MRLLEFNSINAYGKKTAYNTRSDNPLSCLTCQIIGFNSKMSIFFESFQHQMCSILFLVSATPQSIFLFKKTPNVFSVNSPHGRFIFPSICRDINFRVPVTSGAAHVRYILYSPMPSSYFKSVVNDKIPRKVLFSLTAYFI